MNFPRNIFDTYVLQGINRQTTNKENPKFLPLNTLQWNSFGRKSLENGVYLNITHPTEHYIDWLNVKAKLIFLARKQYDFMSLNT